MAEEDVPAFDAFLGISPGSSRGLGVGFGVAGAGVTAALTGLELGAGVVAALSGFGVEGFGVGGADGFALDGAESPAGAGAAAAATAADAALVTTAVGTDGGGSSLNSRDPECMSDEMSATH